MAVAWYVLTAVSASRQREIRHDRNMAETIKEAYGWLAKTYQEGDQIYLFGWLVFSF